MRVGSAARFQRAIYCLAALNPGGRELRSLPLGFPARHLRSPDGIWRKPLQRVLDKTKSSDVAAIVVNSRRKILEGCESGKPADVVAEVEARMAGLPMVEAPPEIRSVQGRYWASRIDTGGRVRK
jgi:hypothetical protein